jgi:CRISPR-associated protein Cas1
MKNCLADGHILIIFNMQLIIHTANTKLSVRNKSFYIESKTKSQIISTKRVSSIAITTNCDINASVIKLAANRQIPIYFFNNFGTMQARMCSPLFVNLSSLRRKQLYFYDNVLATQWVIYILEQKTALQLNLLKQLANRKPRYTKKVNQNSIAIKNVLSKTEIHRNKTIESVRGNLTGLEGSISRIYFKTLVDFLPEKFKYKKRTRRPALDYFNAGLNYLYGMTYSIVESGIYAKGLDPYSGFMHAEKRHKPSLVYDLIEPIRPLIDKIWVNLILDGFIEEKHFVAKEKGYWLNKEGKRIVIPSFNEYLYKRFKIEERYYTLKDYIYTLSNDLGKLIELSVEED